MQVPTDESLGEMEVAGRPYSQGRGVLTVHTGENMLKTAELFSSVVLSYFGCGGGVY